MVFKDSLPCVACGEFAAIILDLCAYCARTLALRTALASMALLERSGAGEPADADASPAPYARWPPLGRGDAAAKDRGLV